jgi:hypothetical protein
MLLTGQCRHRLSLMSSGINQVPNARSVNDDP